MENGVLIGVIACALAIYAIIDIAYQRFRFKRNAIWIPIVMFIPIVGPLIYFVMKKKITSQA